MDDKYKRNVQFDAKLTAKNSSVDFKEAPLPEALQQRVEEMDRKKEYDVIVRKLEMKFDKQHQIDRAHRRLKRVIKKYQRIKNVSPLQEELERVEENLRSTEDVFRAIQRKNRYEVTKRAYEEYRDSGKLEKQVRAENNVDDAMEFTQNWGKTWCLCATDDTQLAQVVIGDRQHSIGAAVGEVAAALTGEAVVRLFLDTVFESSSFLNAAPVAAACSGLQYDSTHSLSVSVALDQPRDSPPGCGSYLFPGSHHTILNYTKEGKELDRLQVDSVFDIGRAVRGLPLPHGGPVLVPPLPPGAALITHHYLLVGGPPQLRGSAHHYLPPVSLPGPRRPSLYTLTLVPDRSAYDGRAGSWLVEDTHGPLHGMKKGELLVEERKFPVLYRALDIE
ncbi:hypothetical protein AGDE_04646 [Angomonas deanei]|nr:hypothetical protein AGDE_04646 [Angomonas deanei]|eukprot:EPY39282.1 hypothetical protein AGDE_04646 [Angomonas deanei]